MDGLGNPIDGKGPLDKGIKKSRVEVKAPGIIPRPVSYTHLTLPTIYSV